MSGSTRPDRPFRVLGMQQVAIGALDKQRLRHLWVDLLGLSIKGEFRSERENVDEDICALGQGAHAVEVDLMQPLDAEKKPAVHATPLNHIGLWVDDLPLAVQWLAAQGLRFAPGGIRKGAAGHDICFVHPKGNDEFPVGGEGVLIELVQAPAHLREPVPRSAVLCDVSLRDGLQSISQVVPTSVKCQWLDALYAAGVRHAEIGSFVPASLLPQLADTADLLAHAKTLPGLHASVLVPNLRGAQAAFDGGADALLVPLSASAAHSRANLRRSPDEVIAEIERIVKARDSAGSPCKVEVGLSTAFGCTLQGEVAQAEVLRLLRAVVDIGVDSVGLADTVGFADPLAVQTLFNLGREAVGTKLQTCHFHDTRGLGSANAFAAWQAGVTRFDASLGGIGGCPHAPGASGNVALEDLAFLFDRMGVHTGVDTAALLHLRQPLAQWIQGDALHGAVWRGGLHSKLPAVEALK